VTHLRADPAWLLEMVNLGGSIRVSLMPIGGMMAATLLPYETHKVDFREVDRLTSEMRVLLGRANMRGQLDRAAADELRKLGHLLFDELLPGRTKAWLREADGVDLLLRTDESLVDVPWELLHTGKSFLALRANIGRLIAAEDVAEPVSPRVLRAPYDILIVADPCGDLDAAYEEGLDLRDDLDAQTFLRVALKSSEVPRAYLRENVREFDVLHFAGHAEIAGRGDGWLLSDGRFTVEDIERLSGGRPFPSLVFANACGSGSGRRVLTGGGATGSLARAMIHAGVRHFIGTHWDLPDEIASEFARHFYGGLAAGLSVGGALRRARTALSVSYGEATVLWGSYCLYGDPHYVYFPEALGEAREAAAFDLPIATEAPAHARAIRHTMDLPVSELLGGADGRLGPHPSLRSEAVLAQPSLGQSAEAFTRALAWTAAIAALLATGVLAYSAWPASTPPPVEPTPSRLTVPALPVEEPDRERPSATERDLLEREEAERLAPPKVDFQVTAQTQMSGGHIAEVRVQEGTRLRSGDNLRVSLEPDRDVYAAVVLLDGRGEPQQLFPHPSIHVDSGSHLRAGARVALPDEDRWWKLDEDTGVESLLLLVSKKPMASLDGCLKEIAALRAARPSRARGHGVVIRGVGGVTAQGAGAKRKDGTVERSSKLGSIHAIATRHGFEVVRAVTYIHVR
jgi:hypothetical protein